MLSSPSTQPLYLPNVTANKKQTQLENRGPGFLCISPAVRHCSAVCVSTGRSFPHTVRRAKDGRSRTGGLGELRYAREWSEDTAQDQTGSESCGGGGLEMSQRFVWATRDSSSALLLDHQHRSALIQANSSGTKDSYHSLRWKEKQCYRGPGRPRLWTSVWGTTAKGDCRYPANLVSGRTLDELVIHCSNGLPQPGSHLYTLLGMYQHGVYLAWRLILANGIWANTTRKLDILKYSGLFIP